jgi:hypothetical protein
MVQIDQKEVAFSATFFAEHSANVQIHAPLGGYARDFRFNVIRTADNDARLNRVTDASGVTDVEIRFQGTGSFQAQPVLIGRTPDGADIYMQYLQQAVASDASLVHFYILKSPAAPV